MCALIARTARPRTLDATDTQKKLSVEEVKKKNRNGAREARTKNDGPHQRKEFVHFNHT